MYQKTLHATPLKTVVATMFLATLPQSQALASYTFADGTQLIDYTAVAHEYDSDGFGNPVHIYMPETAIGSGYGIQSAAAVSDGNADDGAYVPPLTVKALTSLGSLTSSAEVVELRAQARFDTEFEILAAGTQTLSMSWDGDLFASGDAWAWYTLRVGFNPYNGIYDQIDESDYVTDSSISINESRTLSFDFAAEDVGDIYNLQVFLTTYVSLGAGDTTSGAYADFYDSFTVTGWSDGLSSVDGVQPVPLPAGVWLFTSGLMGFALLARRNNRV